MAAWQNVSQEYLGYSAIHNPQNNQYYDELTLTTCTVLLLFRSFQAPSLLPTRHNLGKSPARLRSSSTSLLDVANNNKIELSTPPLDTSSAPRWRLNSLMGRRGWVFPCALAALSSLILPSVSHAIDLASISGGAAAAVANTNSIMSSLAETGFYQAFSLVFVSEIGDKTFFIAGLLAMKTRNETMVVQKLVGWISFLNEW